jgi:membrane protease YdiL (CAAX protease family)
MDFTQRHPSVNLMIFIGFFIAAIFIAQFLALVMLYPFLGSEVMNLGSVANHPENYDIKYKNVLLFLQGFTSFFSMILAPLVFLKIFYPEKLNFFTKVPNELFFISTVILVIIFIPANAWIADWNMSLEFPDFLVGFNSWAAAKELELKELTEYLTMFDSQSQFYFGLLVIAVIPAIGEELIFRGVFQNLFNDWFKNMHAAIWISAIIFSAIHIQFFGFFPRMFLGALFGYLYAWTGNMLIPMTGHFINNGFTLSLIHLKNQNKVELDLETTKDLPMGLIVGSAIAFAVLLVIFKIQVNKPPLSLKT